MKFELFGIKYKFNTNSFIQWRLGIVGREKKEFSDELNLGDIFRVDTRFLITTYLLIYPELSLSELTKKLGKSKSTVVEHLKKMVHAGIINKRSDDSDHRNLKKLYLSLNMDKISQLSKSKVKGIEHKSKTEEDKKAKLIEGIEVYLGFIDVNLHFLTHWRTLLEDQLLKVKDGKFDEWEKLKKTRLSIFQPYSAQKALELKKKLEELFNRTEEEDDKNLENKKDKTKPVFVTTNIFPVTSLLDQLKEKKK